MNGLLSVLLGALAGLAVIAILFIGMVIGWSLKGSQVSALSYIGQSTAGEIAYARGLGKPVDYLQANPARTPDEAKRIAAGTGL